MKVTIEVPEVPYPGGRSQQDLLRHAAKAQRDGCTTGRNLRETVADLLDRVVDEMDRADSPAVRVGQVWADNDKRSAGRQVRVVKVDATHAVVELVGQRGRPAEHNHRGEVAQPGRRTRIRLDRFRPTSTGYRLVEDAPEVPR